MSVTHALGRRKLDIFIACAVALCAAVAAIETYTDRNCREIVRAWYSGQTDQALGLAALHNYDKNFHRAAPEGNLAIRFLGFDPGNPQQVIITQEMFCRGAYALYPRRAWVVPEGTVLNGGLDALAARFSPTPQWLREHDVRVVVEVRGDNEGTQAVRLVPVPPDGAP